MYLRSHRRLGAAALCVSVVWCILYARLGAFSEQLPELNRIYNQSAAMATLWFVAGVTTIALIIPGRSFPRTLTVYAVSACLATGSLGMHYWDQTQYFSGKRLDDARRIRWYQAHMQDEAEQLFQDIAAARRVPPADSIGKRP